jgi:hypothetical protein
MVYFSQRPALLLLRGGQVCTLPTSPRFIGWLDTTHRNTDMTTSKGQFKTIDQYIDLFPQEVRDILQRLRQAIKQAAPEVEEAIKYRMPTFVFHGNLVYFAAWKKHIGFYPITSAMEASI